MRESVSSINFSGLFPELREHCLQVKSNREEVKNLIYPVDEDQFNWKPSPGHWSAGECLEHMNVIGLRFIPAYDTAIKKGRQKKLQGNPPFKYTWLDQWFISYLEPSSKLKMKTPKIYKPAPIRLDKKETFQRFLNLRDEYLRVFEEAQGLDLKRIKVASPAIRWLRLSLGAWFRAGLVHEERHILQMKNILNRPDFPIEKR